MRFHKNRSGSSAVEFAAVFPVGLLLLLGGMEVGQEITAARKTVRAARAAADLTSQVAQLSSSGITTVLNAASTTIAPLPVASLGIVISEVTADAKGQATVTWSKALNAQALTVGAPVTAAAGVLPANSSMILAQTKYNYTPSFGSAFIPARTLSSQIYMSPRISATVDLTP